MSNYLIGLGATGIVLLWVVVRYFAAVKRQQREALEQQIKEEKYKRVLERARLAEHQEKVFKARTGHVPSQLSLAKEYELTNLREAIGWYHEAAELNNVIAQNSLARLCRLDSTDPQGEAKSQYWEQVVRVRSKEPEALFELGRYQIRGYGTEVDTEAGIGNITTAAEAGYPAAQLFLGDWYVAESNPEKSPLQAFSWRVRAAINQDAKGCIKTAYCYRAGIGVAKEKARAIYWLERGAELGSAEAQFLVAKLHLGSDANDAAIAYIWFSIAYAFGHKNARAERDNTVQHVGIESIHAVQGVANSVYKLLKNEPVSPHTVIDLLDKVYSRQGYRPTQEGLAALAAGELPGEVGLAANTEACDEKTEPGRAETAADEMVPDEEPAAATRKNMTATKEYRQQNWAASWDNFAVDLDNS